MLPPPPSSSKNAAKNHRFAVFANNVTVHVDNVYIEREFVCVILLSLQNGACTALNNNEASVTPPFTLMKCANDVTHCIGSLNLQNCEQKRKIER